MLHHIYTTTKYPKKHRLTGEVGVRALCYRSMRKSEAPHRLSIKLLDSSPVLLCGRCCYVQSHSGTALPNSTLLTTQSAGCPPVHSCTESEQQWHKPRTVGVKPGPINSMIFTKPVPNRMAQTGVRSGFYRGIVGPLPDP
ncbi:uncharacterized protein LOC112845656 isoform X1 [Oreochromis niloticus]|uniref:uncharacterized protein LOC112842520 isoform X1 n=2 Tax=Oreochromis niloticus TaxID=8128 RepID=UPI000DF18F12|nr:uncharacterized protein LOC112842520 isoform X1 [Oreochromis niloticus]XP_025760410.1 uncharacterized protein LOC112845079 isoform X1 [Oreochromis niloticus]XP_025760621.1 uncharacterized protein LOC112845426 isoform X1 [Oreochromis niloticus]XP_025760855.1 uncharacterized protein LOC112845652 isoform X1 [Oreochromis niloticus]XP_025760858.1 uncharacterized protein LOC112845653 isoform X1 [Oreochromis niloticus]XP_025760862.1 uncharacterized protein LOC112845656 isoform X1 [Oreochromis nilo